MAKTAAALHRRAAESYNCKRCSDWEKSTGIERYLPARRCNSPSPSPWLPPPPFPLSSPFSFLRAPRPRLSPVDRQRTACGGLEQGQRHRQGCFGGWWWWLFALLERVRELGSGHRRGPSHTQPKKNMKKKSIEHLAHLGQKQLPRASACFRGTEQATSLSPPPAARRLTKQSETVAPQLADLSLPGLVTSVPLSRAACSSFPIHKYVSGRPTSRRLNARSRPSRVKINNLFLWP